MLIDALRRRVARQGAQPLLTYYDTLDGSRIELSAVTFANWVDKTANLIEDLGHEDGEPVDIALAETHPAHWVTLVWVAAAWQRGCPVNPGVSGADLLVVGPGDQRRAAVTVACSLHPLGLGFPSPPEGAVDYREAMAQPDAHDLSPLGESTMWGGEPAPETAPRDGRVLLLDPPAGWATVAEALVAPVLGSGSTVVVVGATRERAADIAAAERALLA
ncbi:TIGR03089 family protein [Tessaracoccus sp. G1721]